MMTTPIIIRSHKTIDINITVQCVSNLIENSMVCKTIAIFEQRHELSLINRLKNTCDGMVFNLRLSILGKKKIMSAWCKSKGKQIIYFN